MTMTRDDTVGEGNRAEMRIDWDIRTFSAICGRIRTNYATWPRIPSITR